MFQSIRDYFSNTYYRVGTVLYSLKCIYYLPERDVDKFLNSYQIFATDRITDDTEHFIADYYAVLNHLCALGQVEKMYIPPIMDEKKGIIKNQELFEKQMMKEINVQPEFKVLDVGCGRGRVAAHVCKTTGANVYGVNIDAEQIKNAKENAKRRHMEDKLHFVNQSYNDPLPFEDSYFDALYNIQAFTYAKDYDELFKECYRVMKPGAKFSILDWFVYDKYDPNNPEHKAIMAQVKPLIGAVRDPTPKEMTDALERVGFKVVKNENASINGVQYPLIDEADKYFNFFKRFIDCLVSCRILPKHLKVLIERLTRDGQAFVVGDKMGLFTSVHQIVVQKPHMSLAEV